MYFSKRVGGQVSRKRRPGLSILEGVLSSLVPGIKGLVRKFRDMKYKSESTSSLLGVQNSFRLRITGPIEGSGLQEFHKDAIFFCWPGP